jgi:hypothetical protein
VQFSVPCVYARFDELNWNPACSKTFRRIVRNRNTEDFRWLPYATTLLSTSLWTFYGLLKPGGLLVVTVNGAGAALQAAYVTLYLIYAPRETKVPPSASLNELERHGPMSSEYVLL